MYCTRQDLIDRLSQTGVIYAADDDGDAEASELQMAASLDRAIASAGAEIDAALVPHVPVPYSGSNEWLRQRAVDLAAEHLAARKGGPVPASLAQAAQRSRNWLEEVRTARLRVPGLPYPADPFPLDLRRAGLPRLVNPSMPRKRRGLH